MTKFCSNCGKELNENQAVCLNCGVAVNNTAVKPQGKSRIIAGVLALIFGTLGVHNFYLGNNNKATMQLLITVLTCGIGAIITGIWSLIEAIMLFTGGITTDADGNPFID